MLSPVRLVFGPNDEDGFLAVRQSLLARFDQWLRDERLLLDIGPAQVAGDAGLALDWKWSYSDGDLGLWRTTDVDEFLLDWCPRKLSVSQADSATIPAALAAFTAFLDDRGLLRPGSHSVAALTDAAKRRTDEFVMAMGDASQFGLAKSLFGAAAADGVDTTDPDDLQGWIAEFNARPEDDRRRIIPDTALTSTRRPALPPVALPDEPDVAASRAAAPILARFARFAGFVGPGRKLTQAGNLTLADARVLVDLLGTGDEMDGRIGHHTYKTKSSAELPGLRLTFTWARKAGVVRVAHGRVIATKKGLAIAADPAGFYDRAVEALMAIGPLSSQRDPDGWLAWPEVNELLDRSVVHLLAGPYVAQRPLPLDDLADVATEAVLEAFSFRSFTDEQVARFIETDVVDIVDALELGGILRRDGTAEPADPVVTGRRRRGGTVELTAAGTATTHRLLVEAGYDAPTAGRFADATATALLMGTDLDDFGQLWGEVEAWRRRRSPAEAAAGLATAVRELEDPALRNVALGIMGDIDRDIAGPEVRKLSEDPDSRGFALCWLVDQGLEQPAVLFDPDDVGWFVDVLAHRLVTAGPEALLDTLAMAGGHDGQVRAIGLLWRSPSRATDMVLAAIGELHPTKIVAKAARKARFQRRSFLAT